MRSAQQVRMNRQDGTPWNSQDECVSTVGNLWAGARARHRAMLGRIEELVTQESPPGCRPELAACADLLESWGTAALGRPARRVTVDGLPHLLWPAADQDVLLLG